MTGLSVHMKKNNFIPLIISCILFAVPFFWLRAWNLDLGGDAGRLYFLDPIATIVSRLGNANVSEALSYAFIPHEIVFAFLHIFITSPTCLIAIEHGIQLSLSFYFSYLVIVDLLTVSQQQKKRNTNLVGVICGLVYVAFVSRSGWVTSLESQDQIFLNPLVFYLLFRFFLTS